jgi:hypothetical protein
MVLVPVDVSVKGIGRGVCADDHELVRVETEDRKHRRVRPSRLAVETSSGPPVTSLLSAATPDRLWFSDRHVCATSSHGSMSRALLSAQSGSAGRIREDVVRGA